MRPSVGAKLPKQKHAGIGPFPVHLPRRKTENLSRLIPRQAGEEPQPHDARCARILPFKARNGFIERQDCGGIFMSRHVRHILDPGDSKRSTATFLRSAFAGVVDEDASHGRCRRVVELCSVLGGVASGEEFEIGFMNKGRRGEGVLATLTGHLPLRDGSERGIDRFGEAARLWRIAIIITDGSVGCTHPSDCASRRRKRTPEPAARIGPSRPEYGRHPSSAVWHRVDHGRRLGRDIGRMTPSSHRGGSELPTLSVVIPMFGEEARIGPTLRDALATLAGFPCSTELIVVDDGSRDRSAAIVSRILRDTPRGGRCLGARLVSHDKNRGKGAAVRTGFAAARGQWVLFMDADNAVPVREAARLLDLAREEGVSLVVGSRRAPGAVVEARQHRRLAGALFRGAVRVMGMPLARDTQCGFKLYRRDLADLLVRYAREDGFAFDIEHLAIARKVGARWIETGVPWTHQPGGTVSPIRDGLRMLGQVARIRTRMRTLHIEPPEPPDPPDVVIARATTRQPASHAHIP